MISFSHRIKTLLLVREALTSLLPIVLVMNILVLLSGLPELLDSWGIGAMAVLNGDEVNRLYHFLIPLFVNLSLSTLLAKEKEIDQIGAVLISMVCFFRVSGFLQVTESAEIISSHGSILSSIPASIAAINLLHYFSRLFHFSHLKLQAGLSPRLKKTLNLLVPGLVTLICFDVAGQGLRWLWASGVMNALTAILPTASDMGPWPELLLHKIVSLVTWFVGVHGEHTADGLLRLLKDIPVGESSALELKTFHDVFMNIGGSGSTFAIPLIVLFAPRLGPKLNHFRSIAQLNLPFSLFNVNEILLFGLPILLNPIFLIPLVLAPFVNGAIALTAISLGLFPMPMELVNWMSPPLYSAYVTTQGSVAAVLTQLLCIVVDGCIYYPFLVLAGNKRKAPAYLLRLFGEDGYGLLNEQIQQREERRFLATQMARLQQEEQAQRVLKQLQGGEFLIYFQPKVDARTLDWVGMEALLRFRDASGQLIPPTFLPVLYEQGLSKMIDEKVVSLVFEQMLRWRSQGLTIPPVSINFDKDFLLDARAVQSFMARAQKHQLTFCIEITEHTYTAEVMLLAEVIEQLRGAGHCISIDDFGSGYSSLTSLLELKADEIKLDRKLVIAPEGEVERGQILLQSSIQLCHDLGFVVVTEGIETSAQLQLVQQYGADVVQGYYTGRPMGAERVAEHLQQQQMDHQLEHPWQTSNTEATHTAEDLPTEDLPAWGGLAS